MFRLKDSDELLLDCQSDVLSDLDTRFVVPLLPVADLPRAISRLNPVFDIDGEHRVMATQGAATIPRRMIGERIRSLVEQHDVVIAALDMLITGY
ncbi:CcdB family protein [Sphingomonas panacisoli]|uniref:CcdB family protein n=1 Tax=Sphingomonas panacisoli TaxID=1813879 RepID=UPI001F015441|nr:CcdB family protein [Sphingomonas panacisoli]